MACAPSEDSDQPEHSSSLIRVFAIRMKKALILSYPLSAQRRLWSDWADAQADLSLRWAHMPFCCFCHALGHMANISHNLAALRSWSYEVLIPGQVNWNFLLVLREIGQVGHIGHSISIALVYAVDLSKLSTLSISPVVCFKGRSIYIVSFLSIRTDRPVQAVYKVEKHVTCDVSIHSLPSRPFWISFLLRIWFPSILRLFTS